MKRKRAWIVLAVALVAVTAAKIYSMTNFLDFKTGFYTDGGIIAGAVLTVAAAAVILMAVLCNFDCEPQDGYTPAKSALTAAFCALTGVFVLIQSFIGLTSDSVSGNQTVYRVFSAAGILAGIVFMVSAYDLASGTQILKKRPILALIPSIWGCICLIMLFIAYAAMVNFLESVYHTFTVAFLLLFLFAQAKLFTGIESEKSWKKIYIFGLPAAFLAFVTGIPNCVMYFSGKGSADLFPIGLQMVNILMGAYILAFLAAQRQVPRQDTVKSKNGDSEPVDIHEPAPDAKQAEPIVIKSSKSKDEWVLPCGSAENAADGPEKTPELSSLNIERVNQVFGDLELLNEQQPKCPVADDSLLVQYAEFIKKAYPCREKFVDITESPFYL